MFCFEAFLRFVILRFSVFLGKRETLGRFPKCLPKGLEKEKHFFMQRRRATKVYFLVMHIFYCCILETTGRALESK